MKIACGLPQGIRASILSSNRTGALLSQMAFYIHDSRSRAVPCLDARVPPSPIYPPVKLTLLL